MAHPYDVNKGLPLDERYLTWRTLWALFCLRLNNPRRASKFKFKILDYNVRPRRAYSSSA